MLIERRKITESYTLKDGKTYTITNVPYNVYENHGECISIKDAIITDRIRKHMMEEGLTEYNFEDWTLGWQD